MVLVEKALCATIDSGQLPADTGSMKSDCSAGTLRTVLITC